MSETDKSLQPQGHSDSEEADRSFLQWETETRELLDGLSAFLWTARVKLPWGWRIATPSSKAFEQLTGYTGEEIWAKTGHVIQALVLSEDCRLKDDVGRRALEGEYDRYYQEYRIRHKSGQVRWLGESVRVSRRTREEVYLAGMCLDITERRQAEDALRRSEEQERSFRKELQALHDVNMELTKTESRDELCRKAIELARERLGFDRVGLWLAGDKPNVFVGSFGIDEEGRLRDERGSRVMVKGDRLILGVMSRGLSLGYSEDAALRDDHESVVGKGARAVAPLWDGERVIGFVTADNLLTGEPIPPFQCELLRLFATSVGHLYTRKQTEEALAYERFLLRTLLDNTPDLIYFKDSDGRFLRISRAQAEHLGLDNPDQALGKSDFDFFSPEHAEATSADEMRIMRTGESIVSKEEKEHWPDGRVSWVSTSKVPLRDAEGRTVGTFGISRDISDRKRAEAALQRERDFANNLVETAQTIVLVLDNDGRILRFNLFAQNLTGYSLEDVVGRNWLELFITPEDRPEIRNLLLKHVGELFKGTHENHIVCRDGRRLLIRWYNCSLLDEEGRVSGVLAIGHDVTEIRRREQQLRQATKMEAIGRLAGGIAHGFNNQLTVIKGYCDLLLSELPEDDETTIAVREIRRASVRAAELTGQLLAYSRKQVLRPVVFNVSHVLEEMAPSLSRLLGENIRLSIAGCEDLCAVEADASQFEHAVMNLAVNSRDAMPEGGQLKITAANVVLAGDGPPELAEKSWATHVALSFTDTGTGMDDDTSRQVFDPFFTTKPFGEGTGLGLAIVYGFVKQSGGSVHVSSAPSEGTTITICLPRAASA